jgi:predicted acyltransferase
MYRVDWMLPLNTAGGLGMIGLQRDGIVTVSPSYYQVGAGGYVTGFAIDQPPGGSPMYQLQLYGQVGGPAVIMQGFGWMTISPTNLVSQ